MSYAGALRNECTRSKPRLEISRSDDATHGAIPAARRDNRDMLVHANQAHRVLRRVGNDMWAYRKLPPGPNAPAQLSVLLGTHEPLDIA